MGEPAGLALVLPGLPPVIDQGCGGRDRTALLPIDRQQSRRSRPRPATRQSAAASLPQRWMRDRVVQLRRGRAGRTRSAPPARRSSIVGQELLVEVTVGFGNQQLGPERIEEPGSRCWLSPAASPTGSPGWFPPTRAGAPRRRRGHSRSVSRSLFELLGSALRHGWVPPHSGVTCKVACNCSTARRWVVRTQSGERSRIRAISGLLRPARRSSMTCRRSSGRVAMAASSRAASSERIACSSGPGVPSTSSSARSMVVVGLAAR